MEAIAAGLLAALSTYADLAGPDHAALPAAGALGSLVASCDGARPPRTTSRWTANDGSARPHRARPAGSPETHKREALAARAATDLDAYLATRPELFSL